MNKTEVSNQSLANLIKTSINALTEQQLKQLDEYGAKIYLLTNDENQPEFHISWGNPMDGATHESAESWTGPKAHQDWEAWQEFKTAQSELREYLHQRLPDDLIEKYQIAVDDYENR